MSNSSTDPQPKPVEDSSYEDELIPGHEYDGIHEYDNPIPPWLSLIFIGTIIWSLFYVVAINLGYIDDYYTNLEQGQQELALMRSKSEAQKEEIDAATLQKAADDKERVAAGEKVFEARCVSCHGENAQGMVGPNLTDKYWIHGGSLKTIFETVKAGVPDKGMPPWGPQLKREQMVSVTAYVRSVRGTDPPNAKKPEGDPFQPK